MAPLAKFAALAALLSASTLASAFNFPSYSHGDHNDAIGRRQATRAQIVRRAQVQFENGMLRRRDQPSMTPCPSDQTKVGDGSCCPTANYASAQDGALSPSMP